MDPYRRSSLYFLSLLGQSAFPALVGRFGPRLRVQHDIPPPKTTRVVANESFVMKIMMVRPRPEGNEVMQTPGKLVAAVGVNSLEQSQNDPQVHGQDMQIACKSTP